MKSLIIASLFLVATVVQAKELPSSDVIESRLNKAQITKPEKWESYSGGHQQNIDRGVVFVTPKSVSIMAAVSGDNKEAMFASYLMANRVCVNTMLEAIDMSQNETLKNSMIDSFNDALKSYKNMTVTMAWGYQYKVQLTELNKGIVVNCSLE